MKTYSIIVAFFLITSLDTFGQKVNFKQTTLQQQAGIYIKIVCTLSNLDSISQGIDFRNQLKLDSEILKADLINFKGNTADLILIVYPKDCIKTVQNALLKTGVTWVYVDEVKIRTNKLDEYIETLQHNE